jgi:hypothetical protein
LYLTKSGFPLLCFHLLLILVAVKLFILHSVYFFCIVLQVLQGDDQLEQIGTFIKLWFTVRKWNRSHGYAVKEIMIYMKGISQILTTNQGIRTL